MGYSSRGKVVATYLGCVVYERKNGYIDDYNVYTLYCKDEEVGSRVGQSFGDVEDEIEDLVLRYYDKEKIENKLKDRKYGEGLTIFPMERSFRCTRGRVGINKRRVSLVGREEGARSKLVRMEKIRANVDKEQEKSLEGMEEAVIGSGSIPSKREVDKVISASVKKAVADDRGNVGLLLSGGVDSVLLLEFVTRQGEIVPVFTVVSDSNHPDLKAAQRVAKEYDLEHHVLLASEMDITRAKEAIDGRRKLHKGDVAVYLALELAKNKGMDTVLAADGIDELTGGYWWHANPSDKFSSKEDVFEHYWNRLDADHIEPLLDSAKTVGIEVELPFLDKTVVRTLNRIPLNKRVKKGITKSWWKQFASDYIPEYIVHRAKLGFVSALDKNLKEDKLE